jgi:hypothetical protein
MCDQLFSHAGFAPDKDVNVHWRDTANERLEPRDWRGLTNQQQERIVLRSFGSLLGGGRHGEQILLKPSLIGTESRPGCTDRQGSPGFGPSLDER